MHGKAKREPAREAGYESVDRETLAAEREFRRSTDSQRICFQQSPTKSEDL